MSFILCYSAFVGAAAIRETKAEKHVWKAAVSAMSC